MKERVVVTGIGVVSSVGLGVERFYASLRDGVSGAASVTRFDSAGFDHAQVCEVKEFEPARFVRNQSVDDIGLSAQFAVAATRMGFEDAGLDPQQLQGAEYPAIFGTTDGESAPFEALTLQMHESGSFDPALLRMVPAQQIALSVAREFALTGEALTISTACAAGNYALGLGYDMVASGETPIAICGGSDSVCRKTFAGFYRLGTMAPVACQPFDQERHGILTGEGSAVLILESYSSARARGARIYAEMLGYAINCDATHMVAPDRDSIAACMRTAHQRAGIRAEEVDFVCMHGTGTKANDVTESEAVRQVFGEHRPKVTSIKSSLGHGMGAASAFGAAACCLAIDREFLPPTLQLNVQDPECDVDVIANHAVSARPRVVQNDAFAFGGNNSITIFKQVECNGKDHHGHA
jgi:3-oxoacyl-[acyl-carrier-protein] synthase II